MSTIGVTVTCDGIRIERTLVLKCVTDLQGGMAGSAAPPRQFDTHGRAYRESYRVKDEPSCEQPRPDQCSVLRARPPPRELHPSSLRVDRIQLVLLCVVLVLRGIPGDRHTQHAHVAVIRIAVQQRSYRTETHTKVVKTCQARKRKWR